jgi:hypothetical protein
MVVSEYASVRNIARNNALAAFLATGLVTYLRAENIVAKTLAAVRSLDIIARREERGRTLGRG